MDFVMLFKKSAAVALVLVMALSLTGCSKTEVLDGTLTAATLDGTVEVPLGEISLMLRYDQANMQSVYGTLFGYDNMYGEDMYGTGELYGETMLETYIEEFELLYVLEAEAEGYGVELDADEETTISETAAEFIEANTEEAILALGVDQEMVEHVLTLYAIQEKMYDALTADVDTEVSDEEAAQKRASYVYVSTEGTETDDDGNTIDLTDEEIEVLRDRMQAVYDAVLELGDLDEAVAQVNEEEGLDEDDELSPYELTFGEGDSAFTDVVQEEVDELEEGEAVMIEADNGLIYVVYLITEMDEEATEEEKLNIIEERKDELYDENCELLSAEHEFVTDEDVLALLTFDRAYTLAE